MAPRKEKMVATSDGIGYAIIRNWFIHGNILIKRRSSIFMSKATVNQETCIGCGTCSALCPGVFHMKDDGKADVKNDADYSSCDIHDAIDSCPVDAISEIE